MFLIQHSCSDWIEVKIISKSFKCHINTLALES